MKYKKIIGTDLNVSSICFGTSQMGSTISQDKSDEMLDKFIEMGGNFLDTAHVYADWIPGEKSRSEKAIGRWMQERGNREKLVIGTKGGHYFFSDDIKMRLSREELTLDLNESLEYLQTSYIDFYWLHRDDPERPVAEILETLNEFVESGKVRYFGCSNWRTQRIREAMDYSYRHGLKCFSGNQLMWSIAEVNQDAIGDKTMVVMDKECLELHKETGLAAVPYSSQALGFFTKLSIDGDNLNESIKKQYYNVTNMRRFDKIKQLSLELAIPVTEIVLGYLISQPFVTIPVVGCKNIGQLVESMKAGDLVLEQSIVNYLSE